MANEKKTIKTKLVQVGSEKIDMPFSLSELILDSTSGKTVKEQIADLQPKTDDSLTTDDKTIVGSINELKTDVNDLDTKVGTKADDVTSTPATGLFKYVDDNKTDIVDNYLGGKKLVYLTQAEYDLLSDTDKNDTTKVYNITDKVEKDYQTKTDDTLTTDDKTVVGAINELDTKVDDIKTEIGKKKVPGTPEVVEEYVACLQTDDGALEVVADGSVTDNNTQIELTTANSLGGSFSIGEYVKHVPHMDAVPEVPGTGMYKFVEDSINQALVGGEVDLSGYQEKVDNNLITDDKNLVNVINALADDSHYHEAFTDAEIEAMFDGTAEEIAYYESLIQDNTVSVNRLFSSQEVVNRITQALLDSQKYANDLVGGLSMVKAKKVETKPDTGEELTIYLVGTEGNYHQWMFIEGAWADLGATNITLDGYITTEKLTEELAKKADDNAVLKLDKVTTTMSSTPSNSNVLSELAIKNLLDGKADSTSIPTVTNDLTDALKANYDAAYTHSQTTHFDGDYNSLTNKPTIPTPRTDDEIKSLADEQISKNQKNQLKDYYVKVVSNTDMSDFGIDDLSTLTSLLDLTKVLGYHVRFTIQVNAGATSTLFNSNVIPVDKAGLLILTCEYARGSATYHTYDNKVYASSTDNSTTIDWRAWEKVLTDTDITTTINNASTDKQLASAKTLYQMAGFTSFTEDDVNAFGNITIKTGYVNKTISQKVIPNATDNYYLIKLPWNGNYNTQIWIAASGKQKAYIQYAKTNGVWDTPKMICTTKVADVPPTVVTTTNTNVNIGNGYIKYRVKNGICFVYLHNVVSIAKGKQIISDSLPTPEDVFLYGSSLTGGGDGKNNGYMYVDKGVGKLYIDVNTANVTLYGTFSYPVAES